MKSDPTVTWTCDRCKTEETVLSSTAPTGWHHVHAVVLPEIRTNDDEAINQDWCAECVKSCLVYPTLNAESP